MMIKDAIILFRFHSNFDICLERVRILKHFNPKVPIYGLFGGDKSEWQNVQDIFRDSPIEELEISDSNDRYWKWLHPEHTLREWYKLHGYKIGFKLLFDEEWDILATAPITEIYKHIPGNKTIALTGLESFDKVKDRWRWVMGESHRADFLKFSEYIRKEFKIDKINYASLGPGQIFTSQFLEDFSALELDMEFVNPVVSEIIYPVVAQILGYDVIDTGLYPGWSRRDLAIKFFNCWYMPIEKEVINEEIKKDGGRKIFHPVNYQFLLEDLPKK